LFALGKEITTLKKKKKKKKRERERETTRV